MSVLTIRQTAGVLEIFADLLAKEALSHLELDEDAVEIALARRFILKRLRHRKFKIAANRLLGNFMVDVFVCVPDIMASVDTVEIDDWSEELRDALKALKIFVRNKHEQSDEWLAQDFSNAVGLEDQ